RIHPRRRDDHLHDPVLHLLRAALWHGPRPVLPLECAVQNLYRRPAGVDDADHHRRRHDLRLVYADGSRDRRLRLGHDPRHLPLSFAVAKTVLQGFDGYDRDHLGRSPDRGGGLAVWLGADHDAADGSRRRGAFEPHQQQVHHPAVDQRAAAGDRLLPRADRLDQHPGAGSDADYPQSGHPSRSLRRGDDAQPDDRAVAPAARHGVVRVVADRKIVNRAHHHGDIALADSAVDVADRDYADPGIDALAAAAVRDVEVASYTRRPGLAPGPMRRGRNCLKESVTPCFEPITGCGYGSRRSPERLVERAAATSAAVGIDGPAPI